MQPQFVTVRLDRRAASVRLKLRWDNSPETCRTLVDMLPVKTQVWHAKYANNEVYVLVESPKILPPPEWRTVYPAPGDLLYIPVPYGLPLPASVPKADRERGLLDIAYFYDRASSTQNGPYGPLPGTIVATATDIEAVERMAVACNDVWFKGAFEETMSIEVG
jgi:hypothetical protein